MQRAAGHPASSQVSLWGRNTPGSVTMRTPARFPASRAPKRMSSPPLPTAATLRAAFERSGPPTVGLEEELMVLDPATLDLVPRAAEVLGALDGDPRFKLELPAAQLEIVTPPAPDVASAATALADARRTLSAALPGRARFAAAGVHPFAAPDGPLNEGGRYDAIAAEYGPVARRQLVFGLHVHVAVRGAERALAVHDALRSHLPELAALAANGPYHDARDSGLASVRPKISETLPRQGVPPALGSWEGLAAALRWGMRAGTLPEPAGWWWELRLHPVHGTVELRVPDAQATVADTAAVAAVAHALVVHLADRHEAGEVLPVHPTWRIEENRWSACRHGLAGTLADLDSGAPQPTRERLERLLDDLAPTAASLGCTAELEGARGLLHANGAERQRAAGGPRAAAAWLAERFLG
jgi:carboxylate-amine ligase